MNDALKAIEKLAKTLAEKAGQDAINVSEMTEAVKALAPYYNHLKKAEAQSDDDSDDEMTMGGMQQALRDAEGAENGGTVSRSQRRRN